MEIETIQRIVSDLGCVELDSAFGAANCGISLVSSGLSAVLRIDRR